MKLLITGASGFLGRYVTAAAVRRGHDVLALVRPASKVPATWMNHPNVDIGRLDLRDRTSLGVLESLLDGVDVVIHLAASKTGDLYDQFSGTVIATENLLSAMDRANVAHMVLTSSFAVYEYEHRWIWSTLDETSPLATDPSDRDEYCQTKIEQERLVREHCAARSGRCIILRPGVIYGRDNLWTARLGMQVSARWWIRTGSFAPLPLTYVENCADAVVSAAEFDAEEEQVLTLNVVDGQTPTQWSYMNALRSHMSPKPHVIPIPWWAMDAAARLAWLTNRLFFRGTAKIPGLFVPSRLHARCKPLRYASHAIKATLGWSPRFTWREGIDRASSETVLDALPDSSGSTSVQADALVEQAT